MIPATASVAATADLNAKVAAARADLDRAIQLAGLQNDPLGHAYRAQSTVIGLFPELVARMDATRMPLSDDDMRALERTLATGVVAQVARAVRAIDNRNVLIVAGILVLTLVIGAGGGWWLGHNMGLTETAPFATMAPAEAAGWSRLMRENNVVNALAACEQAGIMKAADGRRACAMPIWLDPPSAVPERVLAH